MHLTPLTDRLFTVLIGWSIPSWVHPNHITLLRAGLIPFVLFALMVGNFAIGVPLFFFAALTDWFDGALARTRKKITPWGIMYDPAVDKMLIVTVLVAVLPKIVGLPVVMALVSAEVLLFFGGWWRSQDGKVRPAGRWGKAKMVAESFGIVCALMGFWQGSQLLVDIARGTLVLAIVFMFGSVLAGVGSNEDMKD